MYAIIEVGAKQYNVKKDDIIEVDRQEVTKGDSISIDKVLLISDGEKVEIGQPYLKDAQVQATVVKQSLGAKTTVYKHRRRKNSHRKIGHRVQLTELKIKSIVLGA